MLHSARYKSLLEVVGKYPDGVVAFSGGVDSTLVLKAAVDVHGSDTMALFADSVFQPPGELENARKIAGLIGCDFRVIQMEPLAVSALALNPPDRCYYCKKEIYSTFLSLYSDSEYVLMDGTNLDDLDYYRPGRKALSELGVFTPLVEASLRKVDIRQVARELGLPNWNKSSASCLATRIPEGMAINNERLSMVEKYESILHKYGFDGCRVRLVPESEKEVKLELVEKDFEKITDLKIRENILRELFLCGIQQVFLDLTGR